MAPRGAALLPLLLLCLRAAQAQLRKIPVAPKYNKEETPFNPVDRFTYQPNFVIQNFAGTRDARYIPSPNNTVPPKIVKNSNFQSSWIDTSNPYTSISGGENVLANEAKFSGVYGLTGFNGTGDVFISDYCIVRRVQANGTINVYAGSFFETSRATYYDDIFVQEMGNSCGFEDNVHARSSLLNFPYGLAADTAGDLYIADTENMRIRKVDHATKTISTIAGNGTHGLTLDIASSVGQLATMIYIDYPVTLAVGNGLLYFVYQRASIAAVDLATGVYTRWLPMGLQAPQYSIMWVDSGRQRLYYAGKTSDVDTGVVIFDTTSPRMLGDTLLSDYSTINSLDTYVLHSLTGDRYGNLYWSSSKAVPTDNNKQRRYCRISMFNIEQAKEYILAGDDQCGFSTVGEAAVRSRVMPSFGLYVDRDGSLLFSQTNLYVDNFPFVDQDTPFFYAGVMQLTLTQPTSQPTSMPTGQPSLRPTGRPSSRPTGQPSEMPSAMPSGMPTTTPSVQPSGVPTSRPSAQPTDQPSTQPSGMPTGHPTTQPTGQPSSQPTTHPTGQPSARPSRQPTSKPSRQPSSRPTGQPSHRPSGQPSSRPTRQPTSRPSGQPSLRPSSRPSGQPSASPTSQPSAQPTYQPTNAEITLTRGQITGTVLGALAGFALLSVLVYYMLVYYRGLHWEYTGAQ